MKRIVQEKHRRTAAAENVHEKSSKEKKKDKINEEVKSRATEGREEEKKSRATEGREEEKKRGMTCLPLTSSVRLSNSR